MQEPIEVRGDGSAPEHEALLAHSFALALLVVLDSLSPAKQVAFVLHDMFGVPFEEIAPFVGRSPNAAKMLARPVSSASARSSVPSLLPRATVTYEALLAVLDPDVVLRSAGTAVDADAPGEIRGAPAVADTFSGRARAGRLALVNAAAGALWAPGERSRVVFGFRVRRGKIFEIDILADPARLRQLDLAALDDGR